MKPSRTGTKKPAPKLHPTPVNDIKAFLVPSAVMVLRSSFPFPVISHPCLQTNARCKRPLPGQRCRVCEVRYLFNAKDAGTLLSLSTTLFGLFLRVAGENVIPKTHADTSFVLQTNDKSQPVKYGKMVLNGGQIPGYMPKSSLFFQKNHPGNIKNRPTNPNWGVLHF